MVTAWVCASRSMKVSASAFSVIDPMNHVAITYVMHVLGFGTAYSVIHPRMRDLVYEGLKAEG